VILSIGATPEQWVATDEPKYEVSIGVAGITLSGDYVRDVVTAFYGLYGIVNPENSPAKPIFPIIFSLVGTRISFSITMCLPNVYSNSARITSNNAALKGLYYILFH
jgi:hypothetical protein